MFFDGADGRPGPSKSMEFRRIADLPRRDWQNTGDILELTKGLTGLLKAPGGTMDLEPVQAAALREIHDVGGLFGPIAVGAGKALITLLAPVLCEAKKPLLLVPAQLRDQTLLKVIPQMADHWRLHDNLTILAYEELSLERCETLLDDEGFDMIVCDEVHFLANLKSGRGRRMKRNMEARPGTIFVGLSGTVANYSIMDYHHTLQWCLGAMSAPVPRSFFECRQWSEALDARIPKHERRKGGCLRQFVEGDDENIRQGFRRRLTETPGVIATSESQLGVSLSVDAGPKLSVPDDVTDAIKKMRKDWETPEGDIICEAVEIWANTRSMACGFYYRFDPPPPREWFDARKAWRKFVRHRLRHNRLGLDTEKQVKTECLAMAKPPIEFLEWTEIRGIYDPEKNRAAVWLSPYMVEAATHWLNKTGGICWVEHTALGEAIAADSGHPYLGGGDSRILDITGPIIASINAHGTGKNLQDRYHQNLVTCPPPGGKVWEQLLGRTHREGQEADRVHFEVWIHHWAFEQAMEQAVNDAEFLEDHLGNAQRLLYCDRSIRFCITFIQSILREVCCSCCSGENYNRYSKPCIHAFIFFVRSVMKPLVTFCFISPVY